MVLRSAFWQAITAALGFAHVPFGLRLLGDEKYGLWVVAFGFYTTLASVDLGISNSARNLIAQAFARKQIRRVGQLARLLYTVTLACALVVSIGGIAFIHLQGGLAFLPDSSFTAVAVFMLCWLVPDMLLRATGVIYYGMLRPQVPQAALAISAFFSLAIVIWLTGSPHMTGVSTPLLYAAAIVVPPTLVHGALTVRLIVRARAKGRIAFAHGSTSPVREMLRLGALFFAIQISMAIIGQVTNVLLAAHYGGATVTHFAVAEKLYGILSVAGTMLLFPMWSRYTALAARDSWVEIRRLVALQELAALGAFVAGLISLSFYNVIVGLWLGDERTIPIGYAAASLARHFLILYNSIFSYALNGLSRIKAQVLIYGAAAVFCYPASLLLMQYGGHLGLLWYLPLVLLVLSLTQRRVLRLYVARRIEHQRAIA